jgi:hypothetical protein
MAAAASNPSAVPPNVPWTDVSMIRAASSLELNRLREPTNEPWLHILLTKVFQDLHASQSQKEANIAATECLLKERCPEDGSEVNPFAVDGRPPYILDAMRSVRSKYDYRNHLEYALADFYGKGHEFRSESHEFWYQCNDRAVELVEDRMKCIKAFRSEMQQQLLVHVHVQALCALIQNYVSIIVIEDVVLPSAQK